MLTRRQYTALAKKVRADPRLFMARSLWIITKNLPGQQPIMRLQLNGPQQKVHDALMAMRRTGKPPRVICLKSRQPGISTYAAALNMATMLFQPYATTLVIAHKENPAEKLFRKVKFMHARLPTDLRPKMFPDRRAEFGFRDLMMADGPLALGSTGFIETAGGKEGWRGMTVHGCHLSEFAFFKDVDRSVLLGVLQCVPKSPESYVIIESTANGIGNAFQTEYARAEAGESTFRPVFIPWYELPDAFAAVPPGFRLTKDERDLKRAYNLSDEQIEWRREQIAGDCQGDEELFDQEYPVTAASAFLVTGRPYFPIEKLKQMHAKSLTRKGKIGVVDEEHKFIPTSSGSVRMWKEPVAEHEYVIGIDPAGGEEEGDPAGVAVLDRDTQEIVATMRLTISPIDLAHMVEHLGYFYNTAMLNPELNAGWGQTVVTECRQREYPSFYIWQKMDRIKHTFTNFFGWQTSWTNKPLLLASLQYALLHDDIMVWDPETVMELMAVRHIALGMAEGEEHDDLSVAVMLAWIAHLQMPLAKTGLPPRMNMPGPKLPEMVDPSAHLSPSHRAVWDEADRALEQAQRGQGPLANPADFVEPDPDGTFPPPEGEEPPGGWY